VAIFLVFTDRFQLLKQKKFWTKNAENFHNASIFFKFLVFQRWKPELKSFLKWIKMILWSWTIFKSVQLSIISMKQYTDLLFSYYIDSRMPGLCHPLKLYTSSLFARLVIILIFFFFKLYIIQQGPADRWKFFRSKPSPISRISPMCRISPIRRTSGKIRSDWSIKTRSRVYNWVKGVGVANLSLFQGHLPPN
jgi:hypothetical protein